MSESVIGGVSHESADGGEAVIVSLRGDVDLSRSPEVRRELLSRAEGKPARLVVDLSAVGYMDSSGVASLVEGLQRVRGYGGRMLLVGLNPRVRSIFEIAKLDSVFQIVDSREEALGA